MFSPCNQEPYLVQISSRVDVGPNHETLISTLQTTRVSLGQPNYNVYFIPFTLEHKPWSTKEQALSQRPLTGIEIFSGSNQTWRLVSGPDTFPVAIMNFHDNPAAT